MERADPPSVGNWPGPVVDRVAGAVAQLDGEGRIVRANAGMVTLLARGGADVTGLDLHGLEWLPVPGAPAPSCTLDDVLAGADMDEVFSLRLSGETLGEFQVRAVSSGGPDAGAVMLLADISGGLVRHRSTAADADAYRILAAHLGDVVLVHEGGVVSWVSPSVTSVLGYRPEDMIGMPREALIHPDDLADPVWLSPTNPTVTVRGRLRSVDGSYAWFEATKVARFADDGTIAAIYTVARSVESEQRLARADADAEQGRATLTAALEVGGDGFGIFDLERDVSGDVVRMRVLHLNSLAAAREGKTPAEIQGQDMCVVNPEFRSNPMWDYIVDSANTLERREFRRHMVDEGGEWIASFDYRVAPVDADRVVVTFRDITADERTRRNLDLARLQAEHAAAHDPLTGLPNRSLALTRLQEALRECRPGQRVAVVYCDLNGFKDVNDAHGHAAGDTVLRVTAERLRSITRSADTAARLAGDEFCLILRDLPPHWDADRMRARINDHLGQPVALEDILIATSTSIGIVVADPGIEPSSTADQLLATADHAMYRHKSVSRSNRSRSNS
jgi:diguanylate cyclase (GGDEF)-like protein/PAS domain S-box-containing protein